MRLALPAARAGRPACVLAVLMACTLAAAPVFARKKHEAKQFLDTSVVTVPQQAGGYALKESGYEPEQWTLGVYSHWALPGAPDSLVFTLYAYPMGRNTEADVAAEQIDEVRQAIEYYAKDGSYTEVVVGERTPYVVVARRSTILDKDDRKPSDDPPFDPTPKPEGAAAPAAATADAPPNAKDAAVLAVLAEQSAAPNNHGQRQSFSFKSNGVPMRSIGYTFYRHLFAFKVRVSVPAADMEQAPFEAAADAAVRYLVPQVDVQNFGTCGTIEIDPDDTKDNAVLKAMVAGMARLERENCASGPGKTKAAAAGVARYTITYPADTWKGTP